MPTLTKRQVLKIPSLKEKYSITQVAQLFNVSPSCIRYWIRKFKSDGKIIRNQKAGRKSLLLLK
jgi:transposase